MNKPFAIILDDKVLSAPNINEPILGGRAQISGSFTVESAGQLAISLASGKLPVKLNVVEERTVSAELGQDSIEAGTIASIFATLNEGTPQERTLRRESNTNAGTFNQSDLPVHFGLGAATTIDELLICWPDGSKQRRQNVAANQYITIYYLPGDYSGDGTVDAADYAVWQDGFGTLYTMGDYNVWRANFGRQAGPGSAFGTSTGGIGAVPEPACMGLLSSAAGVFVGLWIRRRKRFCFRPVNALNSLPLR